MCINSKVKCDHDLYDIGYESPICEWSRVRAVQYAVHPSYQYQDDYPHYLHAMCTQPTYLAYHAFNLTGMNNRTSIPFNNNHNGNKL